MNALVCEQRSDYWYKFKKESGFVSSTEIAAIMGASKYSSKSNLWKEKRGLKKKSAFISPAMQIGIDEEGPTLRECIERVPFIDPLKVYLPGTICDLSGKRISCSPDAMFFRGEKEELWGIEIKNISSVATYLPRSPYLISPDYIYQCFSSMHITGASGWILYMKHHLHNYSVCFSFRPNHKVWKEVCQKIDEFNALTQVPGRKRKRDGDEEIKLRDSIADKVDIQNLFWPKDHDNSEQ